MGLPVGVNLVLAYLPLVARAGLLVRRLTRALGRRQVEDLGIVPARLDLPARALSGGNQQKVLLGRWLAGGARILILDEPTVGVDVGAKADIYQLLRRLAAEGAAILIVSSDMEEVLAIADRVVVMAQGRISRTFASGEATQDGILSAASGEVR
jgi:ribose transport system ATP-binding protein